MPMDVPQLATILVTMLAPYLTEAGKQVAEEMGATSWEKVQELWQKIKTRWKNDREIEGAAAKASSDSNSKDWRTQLAKALAKRLDSDKDFAEEIIDFVGGEGALQQVLSSSDSRIDDITQEIKGRGGRQIVRAKRSVISGVRQSIKK